MSIYHCVVNMFEKVSNEPHVFCLFHSYLLFWRWRSKQCKNIGIIMVVEYWLSQSGWHYQLKEPYFHILLFSRDYTFGSRQNLAGKHLYHQFLMTLWPWQTITYYLLSLSVVQSTLARNNCSQFVSFKSCNNLYVTVLFFYYRRVWWICMHS